MQLCFEEQLPSEVEGRRAQAGLAQSGHSSAARGDPGGSVFILEPCPSAVFHWSDSSTRV